MFKEQGTLQKTHKPKKIMTLTPNINVFQ